MENNVVAETGNGEDLPERPISQTVEDVLASELFSGVFLEVAKHSDDVEHSQGEEKNDVGCPEKLRIVARFGSSDVADDVDVSAYWALIACNSQRE